MQARLLSRNHGLTTCGYTSKHLAPPGWAIDAQFCDLSLYNARHMNVKKWRHLRDIRAALVACILLCTAACVSLPDTDELLRAPSPHLSSEAPAGITDERARFRGYFCAELERATDRGNATTCDDWLHRLPDEIANAPKAGSARRPLQALFVTGAFSECFGESARPFASAIAELAGSGDDFGTIVVGGRSGTAHNAGQIAEFLGSWPTSNEKPLVLFGYSKGTSDILQFIVDYPELASRVSAVVSIAGSVGGSPLADNDSSIYDLLFSHLPSSHCEIGDGHVVDSLRTDTRGQWLAANPLPGHIRYFSLVAFTTRERVARALVPSWELLLGHSRRNDGQLLPVHALLPQSSLLAYLNADHWAVALELENEHEFLGGRPDSTPFPHTALLSATLRLVGQELALTDRDRAEFRASGRHHGSAPDPLRQ